MAEKIDGKPLAVVSLAYRNQDDPPGGYDLLLFARLRTANTDPSGMFSLAAILRPDKPLRLSFATELMCRSRLRGRPSFVPRSRAAAKPALMRSTITLRSNSATAAKTCICKRPAGLLSLVSMPCDDATSAVPCVSNSPMSCAKCCGRSHGGFLCRKFQLLPEPRCTLPSEPARWQLILTWSCR